MENDSPLTVFNLHDLFSAPLQATIDADFEAARQFVRYIRRFGFQRPADARAGQGRDWGALRMVAFGVERDRNGFPNTEVVRIPTLSMIPLPLLEVREADFRFAVRILTREPHDEDRARGFALEDDELEQEPDAFAWRAMLAEEQAGHPEQHPSVNPQLAANMHVNVSVRRGDIPAGIASLIALMNENSQIIRDLIQVNPRAIVLAAHDRRAHATVRIVGIDGEPLSGGAVSAHYRDGAGFMLEAHGRPWRPGSEQAANAAGQIAVAVVRDPDFSGTATETVRLESVVQGFPASQELSVQVRSSQGAIA